MKTSEHLIIGEVYSRQDLREKFRITDKTLDTGIFQPKGYDSVWLFVTETKQKDRTQYRDLLEGDTLEWDGQFTGRKDHLIVNHAEMNLEVLIFYRKEKYEFPNAGFRYEGQFNYTSHISSNPAHFILKRANLIEAIISEDLVGILEEEEYFEGEKRQRYSNYYERDKKLRAATIQIHGTQCKVCGFDFEAVYGERGKGYIEVHHLHPVSVLKETTKIDPQCDMTVLCSNCHRMIHRKKDRVLSPEELKAQIGNGIIKS